MGYADTLFDLTDRVVLVTGGSRGLGREMALAAARCGADVVIASRKYDSCVATAKEIKDETGRTAMPYAVHVARLGDVLLAGRLVVRPALAQEQDGADQEHRRRHALDQVRGEERRGVAEQHGHHRLHGEGQAHPDPDEQRPVARREHEGRQEGLVRQLDQEDRAERDDDGDRIHRTNLPTRCIRSAAGVS